MQRARSTNSAETMSNYGTVWHGRCRIDPNRLMRLREVGIREH
jgi:hypothetical protein